MQFNYEVRLHDGSTHRFVAVSDYPNSGDFIRFMDKKGELVFAGHRGSVATYSRTLIEPDPPCNDPY